MVPDSLIYGRIHSVIGKVFSCTHISHIEIKGNMPMHGLQIPPTSVNLYSANAFRAPNSTIPQLFSNHSNLSRITTYFGHLEYNTLGSVRCQYVLSITCPFHHKHNRRLSTETSAQRLSNGRVTRSPFFRSTQLTMTERFGNPSKIVSGVLRSSCTDSTAAKLNHPTQTRAFVHLPVNSLKESQVAK